MADETRVSGTSLTSFTDAGRNAFGKVQGDPRREGYKAAEVSRMWMTGGGFVGIPQYHIELRILTPVARDAAVRTNATDADAKPVGGSAETPWTCENWHAYHDFMPGSPPTVRVSTTCTAPTNGYHFALIRQEPQGINPQDLLLRLLVYESDVANEVVTLYDIHYSEDTEMRYDSVSIVPDGPSGLEVRIIQ